MDGLRATDNDLLGDTEELAAAGFMFVDPRARQRDSFELSLIEEARRLETLLPRTGWNQTSRAIDIVAALVLIVVLAPVMILIAALIAIDNPGTPFFRQRRVGRQGQIFGCLKFRTMKLDSEQILLELLTASPAIEREWANTRKIERDPRVTRIGRFLRISSVDELPQLFNVLIGDMSLVGPRPIVEDELACYGRYSGHYLLVRPGLTGLWQVTGRSSTTYRRRVATDVYYVRNRNPALDARIALATVPAVLFAKGSV